MKLTKKILSEHHIHNPYNLAEKVGNKIFIDYVPADNGRLTSHYAYWNFVRFADDGRYHKAFTVTHREVKEAVLQQVIALVKKKYGINITDKDVFGGYHPEGTLKKLESMFSL